MDRADTSTHRSHHRLIMPLLALAVGATLAAAAPQALAGTGDPSLPVLPKITLKVSPALSSPNKVVAVTGEVVPVEHVGEFVVLWVQKKSPSGKWKAETDAVSRVLFTAPPKSWQGAFSMSDDVTGKVTGTLGNWEGQVLYELDETQPDPSAHYAAYSLTSALGVMTAKYRFESGRTEEYLGYSGTDGGELRWYFADVEEDSLDIQADSYEGSADHMTIGVLTVTENGIPHEYADSQLNISGVMRAGIESLPQLAGQNMVGNPVRDTSAGGETQHEVLNWSLVPSDVVVSYEKRHGTYGWTFTPKKTGFYRLQAMMPKDAHAPDQKWLKSGWIKLRVR